MSGVPEWARARAQICRLGPQVELPFGHDPCEEYAENEEAEEEGEEAEEKGKREGGGGGGGRARRSTLITKIQPWRRIRKHLTSRRSTGPRPHSKLLRLAPLGWPPGNIWKGASGLAATRPRLDPKKVDP